LTKTVDLFDNYNINLSRLLNIVVSTQREIEGHFSITNEAYMYSFRSYFFVEGSNC